MNWILNVASQVSMNFHLAHGVCVYRWDKGIQNPNQRLKMMEKKWWSVLLLKPKALSFLTLKVASLGCLSPQLGFVKTLIKSSCHTSQLCVCVCVCVYVMLADIHWLENVEKAGYKDHATQDLVVAWGSKMVVTCPVSTLILTSCHVCLAGYLGCLRSRDH